MIRSVQPPVALPWNQTSCLCPDERICPTTMSATPSLFRSRTSVAEPAENCPLATGCVSHPPPLPSFAYQRSALSPPTTTSRRPSRSTSPTATPSLWQVAHWPPVELTVLRRKE